MRRKVSVLGSTGSIGWQALEVIAAHPEEFELLAICGGNNEALLYEQVRRYRPAYSGLGENAAVQLASLPDADIVVLAISGFAALKPLLAALKPLRRIAIANKESLVCGGELVRDAVAASGTQLVPIDSEQSAIFQCLQNGRRDEVRRLILTASGGPFWQMSREQLENVSLAQTLNHPTWQMGRKITLDSATLMNKGLEILEAAALFGFGADEISVLIHPQSIVHSMVEYRDGTIMANLSLPDMRLPIQYALTYPSRLPSPAAFLDLTELGGLSFYKPDLERFVSLRLAYDALRAGGVYPVVYNAANEAAADAYFENRLKFSQIEDCVAFAMENAKNFRICDISDVYNVDSDARQSANDYIERFYS